MKLAHLEQLGTRGAPAKAFAQSLDLTFSGQSLELYWREIVEPTSKFDNPTEHLSEDDIYDENVARFHADQEPLYNAIFTFSGPKELPLPRDLDWDKIEGRFVPVLRGGDSTLSLLRRCAISLERALYKTHPYLSRRNVEQFWNSSEVMEFFKRFISGEFGESWRDKRTVCRAYYALRSKLYDYIDYVKRWIPEYYESEAHREAIEDLSESGIAPDDPLGENPFPESDSRHEAGYPFPKMSRNP